MMIILFNDKVAIKIDADFEILDFSFLRICSRPSKLDFVCYVPKVLHKTRGLLKYYKSIL